MMLNVLSTGMKLEQSSGSQGEPAEDTNGFVMCCFEVREYGYFPVT